MRVPDTASNCPATPPARASEPSLMALMRPSLVVIFRSVRAFSIAGPSSSAAFFILLKSALGSCIVAISFPAAAAPLATS